MKEGCPLWCLAPGDSLFKMVRFYYLTPGLSSYPAVKMAVKNAIITPRIKISFMIM